ncbi:unnamed protein product [Leptidea sinapis]|uniref:Peptidase S1 domain-containing protein n=1 Tax=Leptidea sinapis TaxID=189913 RepID=A0A5E4Q225_9NEOP|nr:unnamed protein product [Leptidea sinapis]
MKTHILLSFVLILLQNESYGEEVEPGPVDDKIVGGYKTNIKEFPYQVSPKIPLKSFNCHPKYDKNNLDYDACVIELEKPLTLNGKTTKAVTLADSGADIPAGTNVTVAGWGFTSDDGPLSNTLYATWLQIISSDKCIFKVTPRNICALRPEKGHNACNGDSGGALVNSATHEQLGIVSYDESYGEEVEPGLEDDKIIGGYKTNITAFAYQVSPMIPVKGYKCHPKYNKDTLDYDVCILQLSKNLTLNGKTTKATTLVKSGADIPVGTNLTITGWGYTTDTGPLSETLNAVWVLKISASKCPFNITPRMFCALRPGKGHNSCNGDSGGAIVNTATKVQMGIVSYGAFQQCSTKPVVFANIGNKEIRQFIKKITGI